MMRTRLLAGFLLAWASPLFAAFEETGYSPRAIAMGSAFTAIFDDPYSVAYNPASIGQLRNVQLGTNYLRQFHLPAGEVDQDQVNLAMSVPIYQDLIKGGIGMSWSYTAKKNYSIDRQAALSYGTRGFQEFDSGTLDLGATLKIMSRNFAESGGATKPTMDLGTLYRFNEKYAVAVSVLNFTGPQFRGNVSDRVPATLKAGISETVRGFTSAFDISRRESSGFHPGSTSLAAGFENWWASAKWGSLALRTGLNLGDQDKTWNAGFGWRLFGAQLDYSFTVPLMGSIRAGHAVGFLFRFGQTNPEGEYERLLKEELGYRKELTRSLEASEIKQWKLAEELETLRVQIDALRAVILNRVDSEKEVKRKLEALQEKHRSAAETYKKMTEESERLRSKTKATLFQEDWAAYEKLKAGGASDGVLQDRVKKILKQYKETGVDLGGANQELLRLLRGQ